jgi:hypothetical protein
MQYVVYLSDACMGCDSHALKHHYERIVTLPRFQESSPLSVMNGELKTVYKKKNKAHLILLHPSIQHQPPRLSGQGRKVHKLYKYLIGKTVDPSDSDPKDKASNSIRAEWPRRKGTERLIAILNEIEWPIG